MRYKEAWPWPLAPCMGLWWWLGPVGRACARPGRSCAGKRFLINALFYDFQRASGGGQARLGAPTLGRAAFLCGFPLAREPALYG